MGISLSPEGRHVFPRMTVRENLELGAYLRRDRDGISEDLDARVRPVPAPQGAREAEGRHDVRRRAADARDRAGADGEPQAAAARRAVDGDRADPRRAHLRDDRRDQPPGHDDPARGAERELRARRRQSAATCSRPARSRSRTPRRPCGRTPTSRRRTSAHDRLFDTLAVIGAKALWLTYLWLASAIVASYLSHRKGYGEKLGLAFGLLLSVFGAVIWLVWPAAPTRAGSSRARSEAAARPSPSCAPSSTACTSRTTRAESTAARLRGRTFQDRDFSLLWRENSRP